MIETGRVVSLGYGYVDGKIYSTNVILPKEREELPRFLDAHPEAELSPGGSIPNIVTAFVRVAENQQIILLSCVGDDSRGKLYIDSLDKRLGTPQISSISPTGLWVGIYNDERNEVLDYMDYFGASVDVVASKAELENARNTALITDIDALSVDNVRDEILRTQDSLDDNGLFILSLSGSNNRQNLNETLSFMNKDPDAVFGTASELCRITHQSNLEAALRFGFPQSNLIVATQGDDGSIFRLDGKFYSVSAKYVPKTKIVDEIGAGDSYMGTMLAILSTVKYSNWNDSIVRYAADVASYASSLVIQSSQPRLTLEMASQVINYRKNLVGDI